MAKFDITAAFAAAVGNVSDSDTLQICGVPGVPGIVCNCYAVSYKDSKCRFLCCA